MTDFFALPSALATRPPALDPRRRRISAAVEHRLQNWARAASQVSAETPVAITEWVALDSRAVPHTVWIVVGTGRARRRIVIENASERVVETEVRAAMERGGLQGDSR